MKTMKNFLVGSLAGLCLCVMPAERGSEVTNGQVTGRVVYADGSAAARATVLLIRDTLIPKAATAASGIDSTTTNENGYYGFPEISYGWYNLLASGSGKKAFVDSIHINRDDTVIMEDVVLMTPGSVSGTVRLQNGEKGKGSVTVAVIGTNVPPVAVDSLGNFTIPDLAPGTYNLHIQATLAAYKAADTVVTVTTEKATTIANPIVLDYSAIPKTGPLSIAYDGRMKLASISWQKFNASSRSYAVYRSTPTLEKLLLLKTTQDTTFEDDVLNLIGDTVIYMVSALDSTQKQLGISNACTLSVSDSLVCTKSVHLLELDSTARTATRSLYQWVWGAACDSSGGIFVGMGANVLKYNSEGLLLSRYRDSTDTGNLSDHMEGGFWEKFALGPDGTFYKLDLSSPQRIVHLASDLSVLGKVVPDTLFSSRNTHLSVDHSGNLIWHVDNCRDSTIVITYSPSLSVVTTLRADGIFSPFLWCGDTGISQYPDQTSSGSFIIYDKSLHQIGSWDFSAGLKRFWTDSMGVGGKELYIGKNGWSVFFPCQCTSRFNDDQNVKTTLFFDGNHKIMARFRVTGRIVDIDKNGTIHWISGSIFSTYRLR
jgi:hypothetical protein